MGDEAFRPELAVEREEEPQIDLMDNSATEDDCILRWLPGPREALDDVVGIGREIQIARDGHAAIVGLDQLRAPGNSACALCGRAFRTRVELARFGSLGGTGDFSPAHIASIHKTKSLTALAPRLCCR